MIRAAQPPAAAKARDTRSPSRRLPRAEKRTRRQQGDTLYHGRLDGRNLAEETHGVELSTTASGGTRRRPQPRTRPAAYPRRARASTCPKTCAPRMVNCKSCARLGANLARRSAHARVRSQSNARHLQDRDNRGLSLLPGSALLELETSGKGCDLHSSDDARSVTV